jgi:hypothetical protein
VRARKAGDSSHGCRMTTLIFASNLCVKFVNGRVYINDIEGFWSYAKERLLKFHGISKDNFIYYLKEPEFR